ncbi:6-bladed beta-propeller [candidate division KSB1 bacterium]
MDTRDIFGLRPSIIIICILLTLSCYNSPDTYTEETVDGVRYVHNLAPLWSDAQMISLEFVQKIGELEGDDENYQLFRPFDVLKDNDGNICILETGKQRISIFSQDGKFLKGIGGNGQGPGEFLEPLTFDIDINSSFYITDIGQRQIKKIDYYGAELSKFHYNSSHRPPEIRIVGNRIFMGGYLWYSTSMTVPVDQTETLFTLFDNQGNVIKSLEKPFKFKYKSGYIVEGTTLIEDDKKGDLILCFRKTDCLRKYSSDGKIIFESTRPLETPDSEHITIDGNDVYINDITIGLGIDNKNRIWTASYIEQIPFRERRKLKDINADHIEFEIFNSEGILLTKLPVPVNFNRMRIVDNSLLLIGNENISVYEYKIVEK